MHSIEITRLNVIRTQIGCVEALWMHRWFRGRSTCILLCAIHCGIWCNQLKTIAIICVRTQYKRWNSKTTNTNAYIFINRKLLGQSLHWSIKLNRNNAALMHVNGQRKNYFYRQSKWIPMALLNSFLLIFFFHSGAFFSFSDESIKSSEINSIYLAFNHIQWENEKIWRLIKRKQSSKNECCRFVSVTMATSIGNLSKQIPCRHWHFTREPYALQSL